jgi:hypothetical protein
MVLAELAKIAVIQLRSDPEPVGDVGGSIDTEVGEGATALTGVHGQPVVVVGVDKTLRGESVDLHVAVEEFELLCP